MRSSGRVSLTKLSLTSPNRSARTVDSFCALTASVETMVVLPPWLIAPRSPQLLAPCGSLLVAYCTAAASRAAARNITLALMLPSRTATRFRPSSTIVASSCWRSAPTLLRTCGRICCSSSSLVNS